jgi:uncharacterized protein
MTGFSRSAFAMLTFVFSCATATAGSFSEGLNAYETGDYSAALTIFTSLAEKGDALAQYTIGLMHHNGVGVLKDVHEAARWWRLSAEQGYSFAQSNLGHLHYHGDGVLKDLVAAHMWANIASANGAEKGGENRDLYEKSMTQEQIAEATRRARACMASNYADCE